MPRRAPRLMKKVTYPQRSNAGNLTTFENLGTFSCNDAAHKHAVTHLNGVQKFWYDTNGNPSTGPSTDSGGASG